MANLLALAASTSTPRPSSGPSRQRHSHRCGHAWQTDHDVPPGHQGRRACSPPLLSGAARTPAHPGADLGQRRRSDRRQDRHLQRLPGATSFYLEERGVSVSVINPATTASIFYSDILFTTQDEEHTNPIGWRGFGPRASRGGATPSPTRPRPSDLLRKEYGVNRSQAHMEYELQMSKEMIQPLM